MSSDLTALDGFWADLERLRFPWLLHLVGRRMTADGRSPSARQTTKSQTHNQGGRRHTRQAATDQGHSNYLLHYARIAHWEGDAAQDKSRCCVDSVVADERINRAQLTRRPTARPQPPEGGAAITSNDWSRQTQVSLRMFCV